MSNDKIKFNNNNASREIAKILLEQRDKRLNIIYPFGTVVATSVLIATTLNIMYIGIVLPLIIVPNLLDLRQKGKPKKYSLKNFLSISSLSGIISNKKMKNALTNELDKTLKKEDIIYDYIDFMLNKTIIEKKIQMFCNSFDEAKLIDLIEDIRVKKVNALEGFYTSEEINKEIGNAIKSYPLDSLLPILNEYISNVEYENKNSYETISKLDSIKNTEIFFEVLEMYFKLGGVIEDKEENIETIANYYISNLSSHLLTTTEEIIKDKVYGTNNKNKLLKNMFGLNFWEKLVYTIEKKADSMYRLIIDFNKYRDNIDDMNNYLNPKDSNKEKIKEDLNNKILKNNKILNKITPNYYSKLEEGVNILNYEYSNEISLWDEIKNNYISIGLLDEQLTKEDKKMINDYSDYKNICDPIILNSINLDNYINGLSREMKDMKKQKNFTKESMLENSMNTSKETLKNSLTGLVNYTNEIKIMYEDVFNKKVKINTKIINKLSV